MPVGLQQQSCEIARIDSMVAARMPQRQACRLSLVYRRLPSCCRGEMRGEEFGDTGTKFDDLISSTMAAHGSQTLQMLSASLRKTALEVAYGLIEARNNFHGASTPSDTASKSNSLLTPHLCISAECPRSWKLHVAQARFVLMHTLTRYDLRCYPLCSAAGSRNVVSARHQGKSKKLILIV